MQKRKKFTRVVPDEIKVTELKIDDVTCGATKCDEGYHCYSKKKTSLRKYGEQRVCKECGTDLIDWERIHKNDINDSDFVFEQLRTEIIRHVFWHNQIQTEALYSAHIKGQIQIREKAQRLLKSRIGKYNNFMDGRQTPMGKEEIVNYAQHATATCCRQCLEAWHNIKMENPLTEHELNFCTDLVMKYITERIPKLSYDPVDEEIAKKLSYEHNKH